MITVISTVCGKVEGHGNALLARCQSFAVKGVRFLGRGKPCVLADGPWAAGIHRRLDPARERFKTGKRVHMRQVCGIFGGIKRLNLDPFQRVPR